MSDDDSEWDEAELDNEASDEDDESFLHGDDDDESDLDEDKKPRARPRGTSPAKNKTTATTKANAAKKRKVVSKPQQKKSAVAAAGDDEDGGDGDSDEIVADKTNTRTAKTTTTATISTEKRKKTRKQRLRRVDFESLDDTIDCLPSHGRLTDRGGYMHTKSTRMKISQANAGNVPWNAGKNRSAEDKAKISAAVRARNRAILLIKLDRLGMTEDEWLAKKKKVKLVREKVRKARLAAKSFVENATALKKKKASKGSAGNVGLGSEIMEAVLESDVEDDEGSGGEEEEAKDNSMATADGAPSAAAPAAESVPKPPPPPKVWPVQHLPSTLIPFHGNVQWVPHVFENPGISYGMLCPHGGPGGLICCETCTANYSNYLTRTVKDVELNRMEIMGSEVKELLDLTRKAKMTVSESVKVARRTPVPLHGGSSAKTKIAARARKAPPQAVGTAATQDEGNTGAEFSEVTAPSTETAFI